MKYDKVPNWYLPAVLCFLVFASFASMMAILDWHSNHKKWTKAAQFTRTVTHIGMLVAITVLSFWDNRPGQVAVAVLYFLDIIVYDVKRSRLNKAM